MTSSPGVSENWTVVSLSTPRYFKYRGCASLEAYKGQGGAAGSGMPLRKALRSRAEVS